jgi:hypothetical protein
VAVVSLIREDEGKRLDRVAVVVHDDQRQLRRGRLSRDLDRMGCLTDVSAEWSPSARVAVGWMKRGNRPL